MFAKCFNHIEKPVLQGPLFQRHLSNLLDTKQALSLKVLGSMQKHAHYDQRIHFEYQMI